MTKRYELAIFDVDGTLLDTGEGIFEAAKGTVEQFSLPMPDAETLRSFIGPPVSDSFARIFGLKGEALQTVTAAFRKRYSEEDLLKAKPYEGIFQTLEELKGRGMKIAVATYKREDYALKLLRHFGFDRYAEPIFGADAEGKRTKSDIIGMCLEKSGVQKERAVMIGDSVHDANGARQLCMDLLAVTYGYGFSSRAEAERAGAVLVAESAGKIAELLRTEEQTGGTK